MNYLNLNINTMANTLYIIQNRTIFKKIYSALLSYMSIRTVHLYVSRTQCFLHLCFTFFEKKVDSVKGGGKKEILENERLHIQVTCVIHM